MAFLDNVTVVLVETQSPGNIGSVARAMKNMGLRQLILVNCQTDLTPEAYQMACGADDVIDHSQCSDSLVAALSTFNLSVGTSSRSVQWIPTVCRPRELAERLSALSEYQRIALVFGPERTGLTNEHLSHCQWLVTIPSNPEFESLNLAHSVAVVTYEIYQVVTDSQLGRPLQRATIEQIEGFFDHLTQCLREMEFFKEESPDRIMATIRQILGRAALEERDVRILRGILRQWSWYADHLKKAPHDSLD